MASSQGPRRSSKKKLTGVTIEAARINVRGAIIAAIVGALIAGGFSGLFLYLSNHQLSPNSTSSVTPRPGSLREFLIPTPDSRPVAMVTVSDGSFWFTEEQGNRIGHITPQGQITEFPVPTPKSVLGGLTQGSDGNLWFYENKGNKIASITPQGQITEFPVLAKSDIVGITAGPDGNLWFVGEASNKIWRMTTKGDITGEFVIPSPNSGAETLVIGPDGNLWFVEDNQDKIGRITPQGQITEFRIPTGLVPNQHNYHDIAVGPDGNIWFTEQLVNKIGRVTPQGDITEFQVPLIGASIGSLFTGPNGNLWFTDGVNHIGQIDPSGTVLNEYEISGLQNRPFALTVGKDRAIWFTEPFGNKIGTAMINL